MMASHYVLDYECHGRSTGFVRISRTCAKLLYALATKQSNYECLLFVMKRGEKLGVGVGGYLLTLDDEESLRKRL